MTVYSKIAIVTGANKGIGLAIVRNLALEYLKSPLNSGPLLIYLTARSSVRGEEAIKAILSDPQLKAAKALKQDGGLATINFNVLDISYENSAQSFKSLVKKSHPDGIDILINNAGICIDTLDVNTAKITLQTNYFGTLAMMTEFLPLIRPGGRLVNLASSDGQLMPYSEPLKLAFIDASKSSIEACTSLMNRFMTEVMTDKEELEGWPSIAYAYAVSKCGVIALTKAMAVETKKNGQELLINACCPGFVNTDMTHGHGVLTVDEGAKMPVLLALGNLGGISGGFWKEGSLIEWCPSMGI